MTFFEQLSNIFLFNKDIWIIVGVASPLLLIYISVFLYVVIGMIMNACKKERTRTVSLQTDPALATNFYLTDLMLTNPSDGEKRSIDIPGTLERTLSKRFKKFRSFGGSSHSSGNLITHEAITTQHAAQSALYQAIRDEDLSAVKSSLRKTTRSHSNRIERHCSMPSRPSEDTATVEIELLSMSTVSRKEEDSTLQLEDPTDTHTQITTTSLGSPIQRREESTNNHATAANLLSPVSPASPRTTYVSASIIASTDGNSLSSAMNKGDSIERLDLTAVRSLRDEASSPVGDVNGNFREGEVAQVKTLESTIAKALWTEIYLGEI